MMTRSMTPISGSELTTSQARRLKHLESQITKGAADIYESLRAIHDERLYVAAHKTFEDYCRERWGMSRVHANRMLRHGSVLRLMDGSDLSDISDENSIETPEKVATEPMGYTASDVLRERHTREVADLPNSKKVEVLREAVRTAPRQNGKPNVTTEHVRRTRENQTTGELQPKSEFNEQRLTKTFQDLFRALDDRKNACGGAAYHKTLTLLMRLAEKVVNAWRSKAELPGPVVNSIKALSGTARPWNPK